MICHLIQVISLIHPVLVHLIPLIHVGLIIHVPLVHEPLFHHAPVVHPFPLPHLSLFQHGPFLCTDDVSSVLLQHQPVFKQLHLLVYQVLPKNQLLCITKMDILLTCT